MTNQSLLKLFEHIGRFAPLDDGGRTGLSGLFELRTLKRREHLMSAGAVSDSLAFVLSGCMRLYHINEFANERTLQFALENWWICDWESFERGQPSVFWIQAIEETEIAVVSRENYDRMFETVPSMERYFRRIFQRINTAAQKRVYTKDTESAENRYWNFQEMFPDFANRVPQYMLASFLGFSPEFLSKIRAKGRG